MPVELQRVIRQTPFRPFVLTLKGGEQAVIEHSENIALDPRPGGSTDFYVLTGNLRMFSTFESLSSLSHLNQSESSSEEQVST